MCVRHHRQLVGVVFPYRNRYHILMDPVPGVRVIPPPTSLRPVRVSALEATRQGRFRVISPPKSASATRQGSAATLGAVLLPPQHSSRCIAPAASVAGRSPGVSTPFHGDGSGMTKVERTVTCPLQRKGPYNQLRPLPSVRSTESFATAKPDVPPPRALDGHGEQIETAVTSSLRCLAI